MITDETLALLTDEERQWINVGQAAIRKLAEHLAGEREKMAELKRQMELRTQFAGKATAHRD